MLAGWERPIFDQVSTQVPAGPPRRRAWIARLDDGDVLDFGGGAVTVAAPGHTPGSLALHLPGPRVLFTGDAVARSPQEQVMLGVFNADPPQAAASFQRLADLDAEIPCFGHGEPLTERATAQLRAAATGELPGR